MLDDWDNRSEMPEMIRDYANREQPALQEYDWAQEHRRERRIPIEIITSILSELDGHEEDQSLPN